MRLKACTCTCSLLLSPAGVGWPIFSRQTFRTYIMATSRLPIGNGVCTMHTPELCLVIIWVSACWPEGQKCARTMVTIYQYGKLSFPYVPGNASFGIFRQRYVFTSPEVKLQHAQTCICISYIQRRAYEIKYRKKNCGCLDL